MLLSIVLVKFWCSTYQVLSFLIINALYFLRQIAVSESNSQLLRINKTCSRNTNQSVAFGWPARRFYVIHSDRRIEQNGVIIRVHVRENSVISVDFDHFWQVTQGIASLVAKAALSP